MFQFRATPWGCGSRVGDRRFDKNNWKRVESKGLKCLTGTNPSAGHENDRHRRARRIRAAVRSVVNDPMFVTWRMRMILSWPWPANTTPRYSASSCPTPTTCPTSLPFVRRGATSAQRASSIHTSSFAIAANFRRRTEPAEWCQATLVCTFLIQIGQREQDPPRGELAHPTSTQRLSRWLVRIASHSSTSRCPSANVGNGAGAVRSPLSM